MGFDQKLVDWAQMRDLVVSLRELLKLEPSDPENLNEALGNILTVARNLFPPSEPGDRSPDICTFSIFNPFNEQHIQSLILKGEHDEYKQIKNDIPLEPIVKATREKEELFIETLGEHPELKDSLSLAEDLQSIAAVAFYTEKHRKPLGVLCLGFKTSHKFAPDKKQFLRMLRQEGSAILQSTWLLKRYSDVAAIGREINEQFGDTAALFKKIANHIPEIIDVSHCFMLSVRQRQADRMDVYVLDEGREVVLQDRPLVGGSGRVIQTNLSLLITHASQQPDKASHLIQLPRTNPLPSESLIFVPLSFRGQVLGVLSVQHRSPNKFDNDDVHILEVLSYHIALAISTQFLYQSLDRLNITGRRLLQQLNSDQLLQSLADEIRVSSGADLVDFYPYLRNEHRFDLPPRASGEFKQPEFPRPSFARRDDISALLLGQTEPVFARDTRTLYQNLGGDPLKRQGNFEEREAIISTAAVPLRVGDEEVGALFVNFRTEQNFDAAQRRLIENLGHYAAIAIKNSRVFADEYRRRAEMFHALREIDRQISRSLDLKTVLETILDLAIRHIAGTASFEDKEQIPIDGAILLVNENVDSLDAKATAGPRARLRRNKSVSLKDDEGISSYAFKNNKPVRVADVSKDPTFKNRYFLVDTDTKSELDVPLSDGNEKIGVINLESTRVDAFDEPAELFLVNVAGRAVLAIKNAQLFEGVNRSRQELQTIRNVERQIVNKQIITKVFQTILDGALRITGATAGHIVLRDEQKGDLYAAADKGVPPERRNERMAVDEGIIGWVMTKKTTANADVTSEEWREIYRETIPGMRFELTVPIGPRDSETSWSVTEIVGVINLEKPGEPAFTDEDVDSLTQFADQALVTIQQSQESDRVRINEAKLSALREIDLRIIGTTSSLDDVMQVIIGSAMELTEAEIGNLHIYEGERPTVTYRAERDEKGDIVVQARIDKEEVETIPARRGIVAHVAETLKPYRTVGDAQADPHFKGSSDVHSNIAVPLTQGLDDLIGVLNLESRMFNLFGNDDESLLEAIAIQAVIAIQKVRGDTYAAASLKRFKLLSSAGEELLRVSGARGIQDAFRIIVDKVHDYLPCNVAIWSYDEQKALLQCEIEKAVTDAGRRYPHGPLQKGQGVNGHVAVELKPVVINDVKNPQPDQPTPALTNETTRSIAVYPILVWDENDKPLYYGNLSLTHQRPQYFKPDDSELFIGLCQQLALTIQRMRVAKERVNAQQTAAQADLRRGFAEFEKVAFGHAHSLGNLLGPITSYLRRMRKALQNQPVDISLLNRDLDHIGTQVEAVFDRQRAFYARATGLSDPEAPVIVSVSTLIAKAKREFPPVPDNIKVTVIDDSKNAEVSVVVDRVIDILFNLLTNAIEVMPAGGEIRVVARVEPPNVHLLVEDTGEGIDREIIDQVFGMHFTTKPEGTGFGLWSARTDARLVGGELTVRSEQGKGATFVLTLPLNASVVQKA